MNALKKCSIASLLLVAAIVVGGESPAIVSTEFIYETAPFPSCHASTLVETKSGLVAAWFGGTAEKNPDVCIWVARKENGKWTAPVEVANGVQPEGPRLPTWNPVLFNSARGSGLTLFYKVGPSPQTWWGMLRKSTDDGKTWGDAWHIPDGMLGPIKNKPVQLADGTVIMPSSTEENVKGGAWRAHFETLTDGGQIWQKAVPAPDTAGLNQRPIGAIQPSILIHADGKLQAIGRSREGKLFETFSSDSGKTWSALTLTALPNPNSGTDAVTLKDGRHLLVYNHTAKGRSPLNVAISKDGKEWGAALVLESDPGEYSYPCVIQSADGLVHIGYTWKRQKIKHVVVDPAKLETKAIVDGVWPK